MIGLTPSMEQRARAFAARMIAEGLDEIDVTDDEFPGRGRGFKVVRASRLDAIVFACRIEVGGTPFFVGLARPRGM